MEQQVVQTEEEGIALVDIFKLLLSKIKVLILVTIIGGLFGGTFAVFRTIDVNYYGTSVEFYVNPEPIDDYVEEGSNNSVSGGEYSRVDMDAIIRLLDSESFAEIMILNGSAIPEKDVWVNQKNQKEVDLDLNGKIDAAAVEVTKLETETAAYNAAVKARNDANHTLSEKNDALNAEWKKLLSLKVVTNSSFNDFEYFTIVKDHYPDFDSAYKAKEEAQLAVNNANAEIQNVKEQLSVTKATTESTVEIALEAWRKTAKYKETLEKYEKALSFSYLQDRTNTADLNYTARSFIYVKISTLNEQTFAEDLLERVKTVVPNFIVERMKKPTGYETVCRRITRTDDVHLTNPNYTTKQAITYGLVAGLAALLAVSVIFIILDRSDKRLRDTEVITKNFDTPILGIVPAIPELKAELAQKKTDKTEVK